MSQSSRPPSYWESIQPGAANDYKSPSSAAVDEKFAKLFETYKISAAYWEDLASLTRFDIVFLCDDSGSMKAPANQYTEETRWQRLQQVVRVAVEVGTALDTNGIDIEFLHRQGANNVTDTKQLDALFAAPPTGKSTPLAASVARILQRLTSDSKPLLLVIATDGLPTLNGLEDKAGFRSVLEQRDTERSYVSILACSDVEQEVGYLDKIDNEIPHVDVLSEYRKERQQVIFAQSTKGIKNFEYTEGDHVARLLLGAVFPKYDNLDEPNKCPCTIL